MLQAAFYDGIQKLDESELDAFLEKHSDILEEIEELPAKYEDSLGFLDPDEWASDEALARVEELAARVREHAEAFVIIGVGGSNNAARAVIKALEKQDAPKVYYAGNSLSPHAMNRVLEEVKGKSLYINVIAKNFETLEPGVGFRVFRRYLKEQYKEEAGERIIVTGTAGSCLHQLCKKHGYAFLPFPDNMGGRYSAVCNVGLFPMAVVGMDVRKLVSGAKDMRKLLLTAKGKENPAYLYGAVRNLLFRKGYRIEMLSFFEPRFRYFAKWWTQLFAESEGKDLKGVYPVAAEYSEDLHSTGQFTQEGSPVIYETFLDMVNQDASCLLEADEVDDGFDYLNEKDLWEVNRTAFGATSRAHGQRLPVFRITVDDMSEYGFGQLFYFFEYACCISGTLLGINPFNQPGVEAYKKYMFDALGK